MQAIFLTPICLMWICHWPILKVSPTELSEVWQRLSPEYVSNHLPDWSLWPHTQYLFHSAVVCEHRCLQGGVASNWYLVTANDNWLLSSHYCQNVSPSLHIFITSFFSSNACKLVGKYYQFVWVCYKHVYLQIIPTLPFHGSSLLPTGSQDAVWSFSQGCRPLLPRVNPKLSLPGAGPEKDQERQ